MSRTIHQGQRTRESSSQRGWCPSPVGRRGQVLRVRGGRLTAVGGESRSEDLGRYRSCAGAACGSWARDSARSEGGSRRAQPSLTRCRLAPGPADSGGLAAGRAGPSGSRLPPGALATPPGNTLPAASALRLRTRHWREGMLGVVVSVARRAGLGLAGGTCALLTRRQVTLR